MCVGVVSSCLCTHDFIERIGGYVISSLSSRDWLVYTLAASPFKPIPNCCGVFDYSPITCTIFSHYDNNNTNNNNNNTNNNNNNTNNNNNNSNTINNKIVTDVSNVGIIICISI